jgi:XisI protein
MEKVDQYRQWVQDLLHRYVREDVAEEGVEIQLVMDTVRDHYQWINLGWHGLDYIYDCFLHIDIKDGKIWIQRNWTEENPAEALVKMGVPRQDIVLGLQPPSKRPYTDYGVA